MAIKTVTNENLAEFVASRPQPANITSPQAVIEAVQGDGPTPGNPVIKTGEEKLEGTPDPGQQPDKARKTNPIQPRIDELTREKKELDEAFQSEYEERLRLEGEVKALRLQLKPADEKVEAPKELKAPDPSKYTDQAAYDVDLKAYQDQLIDARVEVKLREKEAASAAQRADEAMAARVAAAKEAIPDFQQVIEASARAQTVVPVHIKAALIESELGPQLAYHLAKHPEEQKRIFALPVAKALLELGKIELKYTPKAEEKQPETPTQTPETSRAPAPIAKLKDSGAPVTNDLSKPMPFTDYKRQRIEQIRASGRRRH